VASGSQNRARRPTAGPSPTRAEYVVFTLATAAIVLHVLVDSFLALESGAKPSDHVLAAVVPSAVTAVAILTYRRLRAGARATVALVFGVLALVGASVALVDAVAGGLGADEWTGFLLLLLAGLVLCVMSIRLLWRSRKPGGRRYLRRAVIAVVAAVIGFEVVLPAALALVATHRPDDSVEAANLGRRYEEVTLRTTDGLSLEGWYVPSRNGAAVIVFPDRRGTKEHARMLARHGYGVLALDMRGYGESEGDPNAFGWGSARDVDAAVAFLQDRPDVDGRRIGGLGLSVGGEQLLEAAAGNAGLRAVVSEGAGERSVRETLLRGAGAILVLPQQAVLTAAVAVLSGEAPPSSLDELVRRIAPRPILLVYAGQGQGGEDLNTEYYAAAGQPKTLWEIPEASHTAGLDARPGEYEERVISFFDDALLRS
jgi:pimeloyl-ACP methyl ester carboxylesterase